MDPAHNEMDFSAVSWEKKQMRIHYAGMSIRPIRSLPVHHHEPWVVIAYTFGKGSALFASQVLSFQRGTVLCVPPRMPYAETSVRGFNSAFIAADGLPLDANRVHCSSDGDETLLPLARLIVRVFNRGSVAQRTIAEQLFESLVNLLAPAAQEPDHPHVDTLLELIHRDWADPDFNLADAMREIPLSEAHLRRTFTRVMKVAPVHYLLGYRMMQARRLLSIGGYAVKEVSQMCGFSDPYYFSRAFRKLQRKSPTQWLSQSTKSRRK